MSTTHVTPAVRALIRAYDRFVPHQLLRLMGKKSVTDVMLGDCVERKITILFADMRDFTTISETMTPRQNFGFLNAYFQRMEPVIGRHHGIIDKYIGDAVMALFPTNANDALDGALGMLQELAQLNEEQRREGSPPIAIGIGLNTGLMMLGTIGGNDRMDGTVISDAVNLGSRIESMTKGYGAPLLISEHTFYNLETPSQYHVRFADRVRVKGKEQPQSVYEVFNADPPEVLAKKRRNIDLFERAIAYYHFKEVPLALGLFTQCVEECPADTPARAYVDRCRRFLRTGVHDGTGEVDLTITWTPDLEIGNPLIDEQHRQLFNCANEFVKEVRRSRNSSNVRPMMDFLGNYVHDHFKTEERCMEENGYPFLESQKEQHERFSRYLCLLKDEIETEIDGDRNFLLFKLQVFVMDWIVTHTTKADRHFGRFLRLQHEL